LELGRQVEHELTAGEPSVNVISLAAGDYADISLYHDGVGIRVNVRAPDGESILELRSPNQQGAPQPFEWIAKRSGPYRVIIETINAGGHGSYELTVEALRKASEQDVSCVAIDEAFRNAHVMFQAHSEALQQKAVSLLDAMAENSERCGSQQRDERQTLLMLARRDRERNLLENALKKIETAMRAAGSVRSQMRQIPAERRAFVVAAPGVSEFYIDLLMQLHQQYPRRGYEIAAFEASERTRYQTFMEALSEAHADVGRGVDPALLGQEQMLRQRMTSAIERQLSLPRPESGGPPAAESASEIERLTREHEEIVMKIRAGDPKVTGAAALPPVPIAEIQRELAGTVLLEYSLGDERSFLWVVSSGSVTSFELSGRAEIEAQARAFHARLSERKKRQGDGTARQRTFVHEEEQPSSGSGETLSRLLLGPVAPLLKSSRVYVVADGALDYIPFALLPQPGENRSAPLLESHEIVNLPSASTLVLLHRQRSGRKPAPKAVAILADPVFDASDPRVKVVRAQSAASPVDSSYRQESSARRLREALSGVGLRDGGVPRLPFTRREADAIGSLTSAEDRLKAVGFEASLELANSARLSDYRILHFATHGLMNAQNPELSGLLLSLVDQQGRPRSGFLRLEDIYQLKLPVELVVLSACRTAMGKEIRGEGMVGLTWGFMYAGANRVVASLWNVDDLATAELMKVFYKCMLLENMAPVGALRAAQMELRRHKRWQSPYYWGGFIVLGD
jgi:CHAT domain-containing protein